MVAAATGANVLAFEPDPVARGFLEQNIRLNEDLVARVEVVPTVLALSDEGASLSSAVLGDSGSSLMRKTGQSVNVRTLDVRSLAKTEVFKKADLVKIDAEGFEYSLIPALSNCFHDHKPTLLLSVHGYVISSRFNALPRTIARIFARASSVYSRLRLIVALRHYEHRREYLETGKWIPLHGRALVRFLIQIRDTELVLSELEVVRE